MIMPNLTGKDFLVGLAVGYFLLPYVTKNAAGLVGKLKGDG